MVLDRAMHDEPYAPVPPLGAPLSGQERARRADGGDETGGTGELQRRGLLGPKIKGVLVLACKVLEKGERFGM